MTPRTAAIRRIFEVLALALAVVPAAACASADDGSMAAQSAKSLGLSRWTGVDRDLFDDQIDPAALGFVPPKVPRKDQTLWARAQAAEIVGRVRVQTVTVDNRGGDLTFHIGLRFANQLLAPTKLEERDFEITIEPRDPAYGIVRALDTGLQGRTFVGFVKRFAGNQDEVEVHFFLAPDSAEVASAVQEAVAVKEVSKR